MNATHRKVEGYIFPQHSKLFFLTSALPTVFNVCTAKPTTLHDDKTKMRSKEQEECLSLKPKINVPCVQLSFLKVYSLYNLWAEMENRAYLLSIVYA